MHIVDIRKYVPFSPAMLDFTTKNVKHDKKKMVITLPLVDPTTCSAVLPLAYDIASKYDWHWPDPSQTSLALGIDYSRSFLRFSLVLGTQPMEAEIETDELPEWTDFERKRKLAVQIHIQNGNKKVFDTYPLMLTADELDGIKKKLFTQFSIF